MFLQRSTGARWATYFWAIKRAPRESVGELLGTFREVLLREKNKNRLGRHTLKAYEWKAIKTLLESEKDAKEYVLRKLH